MAEKNRLHKKKEITITLKSEPLKPDQASSTRPNSEQKRKQRDFKKKGTNPPVTLTILSIST